MTQADKYFDSVYRETYQELLGYSVSHCGNVDDVHDILQNTYTAFYKRIVTKGYADIDSPKAYLLRLLKHQLSSQYGIFSAARNFFPVFSKHDEESFENIEQEISKNAPDFSHALENGELIEKIFALVNSDALTGKIFTLHYLNDMKIEDIAKLLGLSVAKVKNRLYRTLKKVRENFDGFGNERG